MPPRLIIKRPTPPVVEVIKAVGEFCRNVKGNLEAFAKADSSIVLDDAAQGLPTLETKARDAISSATSKQILLAGGKDLEFRLLLTQHEALNYITHLASVLSERERDEGRKSYLKQVAKESAALHERVVGLMKGPYVAGKPNSKGQRKVQIRKTQAPMKHPA